MSLNNCCICSCHIDRENAEILTMGGYGVPRYLCSECANELNIVTGGVTSEEITGAIKTLGDKMTKNGVEDRLVIETMSGIFSEASERAEMIANGTYDFSLDENADSDDEFDDIPPELEESEEDKMLDEVEKEKSRKLDKIITWISAGIFAATIAYLLYYYLF